MSTVHESFMILIKFNSIKIQRIKKFQRIKTLIRVKILIAKLAFIADIIHACKLNIKYVYFHILGAVWVGVGARIEKLCNII